MTQKEVIEIILSISSLLISWVAIWQSRKSIKLTEKSIRDANRPYIGVNVENLDTVYFEKFLIFKNYGNTSARITKLYFKSDVEKVRTIKNKMQSLVGGVMLPGQKFTSTLPNDFKENIVFELNYQGEDGVQYEEIINIKTDMSSDLLWSRQKSSNDSDIATAIKLGSQTISKALK